MLEDRDTWIDPIRPDAATALCAPAAKIEGGSHTYLLMDAGFVPALAEHLKQLAPSNEFCSLYEGLYTGAGIEHIAPYLIRLPDDPEQRLQIASQLIKLGRGKPVFNLLCSDGDLDALTVHLQRQFEAVNEQGQTFLSRLADTRAFSTLITILTSSQRKRLLAGIRSWSYVDREGGIQTIEGMATFDGVPASRPYEIDREQERRMEALALPDAILRYTQLRSDRLGTLTASPSAAYAVIQRAIQPVVSAAPIDEAQAYRTALAQLRQGGLLRRHTDSASALPTHGSRLI